MDGIAEITECIKQLQNRLEKLSGASLKEAQTRLIFIDPLVRALRWDMDNPAEVDLEHTTVDGKAVDYALKISGRVILLMEAKSLSDPLTDVKAITQIVGYASNEGVEWCVLTNGRTYKIYRSTEKSSAPEKLLYEVSIDPKASSEYISVDYIAEQLWRLSPMAMNDGVLNRLGEEFFARDKVVKALDKLFSEPPPKLISMVKAATGDESIKSSQVKEAIKGLWREWNAASSPGTTSRKVAAAEKVGSTEPALTPKRVKIQHPPVKTLDGRILGSILDFARNHNPPLKYEGMRTAIDVLTACKSPDGDDYDFHYDIDYRQDGVYIERKQGRGYRTLAEEVYAMRRKAELQ